MFKMPGSGFLGYIAESFVDNILRDYAQPKVGSILYCDLAFGNAEHSGIYIGNNEIAHLDGSGNIEVVSPKKFINRLNGFNSAINIYISCRDTYAVGCRVAARRAKSMIGKQRKYSLITNNCHQFSSGCLTGDFENSDNFLWMLKFTAEKELQADNWRIWETKDNSFVYSE